MTTVADLLIDEPGQISHAVHRRLDDVGLVVTAPTALPRGSDLSHQVADAVAGFLQMPVGNVLFWAWDRQQAVRRACEQTIGRPGATQRVVVGHHTLTSVQRPSVGLDLGGQATTVLELVLTLTMDIDSVVVDVLEGRVVGSGAGSATCSAELAVARPGGTPRVLFERTAPRVELSPYRPVATAPPRGEPADPAGPPG